MWTRKTRRKLMIRALMASAALLCGPAPEAAEIYRDSNGVPQIYGKDNFDLFAGYGYVAGQDRLFQLEMRRRQAYGTTAEVLGAGEGKWTHKYIEKDQAARRALDLESFKSQLQAMNPQDRLIVEGYAAGLNKAIDEVLADRAHKLSRPFADYGFLPTRWTALDVLVTSASEIAYYSDYAYQGLNLDLYNHLRKHFPKQCDDIFDQILWQYDPKAMTTLQDQSPPEATEPFPPARGCADVLNPPNHLLLPTVSLSKLINPYPTETILPRRASMAWAVGADKAAGARSIFLNGPQTGWHRPSHFYAVGLHGGDFDFVGLAPSALLPFEVGVSANHSWGFTAGLGMQEDVFQERLRPENHNEYLHNGNWLAFGHRHEVIHVKGGDAVNFDVETTLHGPLIERDNAEGVAYAQSTSWKGSEVRSVMAWLHSAAARTPDAWLHDAENFDFNYNWFYSDKTGTVGFAYTGKFPRRHAAEDSRLPVAGTGEFDYPGYLPQANNPHLFTSGYIVNFNNKPTKIWPNSGLFFEQWAVGNQVEILRPEFTGPEKMDIGKIWAINHMISFADVNAHPLMPFIADAAKLLQPESDDAKAAALMLSWNKLRTDSNRDGLYDSPGQVIFDAWLQIMVSKTLDPVLAPWKNAGYWIKSGYQTTAPRLEEHPSAGTLVLIEALAAARGQGGIPQHYDFFQSQSPLTVINEALHEAVAALKTKHQGPMESWRNPVVIQRYFASDAERIPMTAPGPETSFGLFANRGGINILTEYDEKGDVHAAYVNPLGGSDFIPPQGQHENIPDYRHQLDLYTSFQLAPVYLKKEDVLQHVNGQPLEINFD
jgi:penicillin amidase